MADNLSPSVPSPEETDLTPSAGPSRGLLWFASIILLVIALYLLFGYLQKGQSEVVRKGVKADGQVRMKDTQTAPDGSSRNVIHYTFTDASGRNHMGQGVVSDGGFFNGLKADGYIKVWYMPNDPGQSVLENSEGSAAPHAPAVSFLAWSMIIVGAVIGIIAFRTPPASPKPKRKKGVTITRR